MKSEEGVSLCFEYAQFCKSLSINMLMRSNTDAEKRLEIASYSGSRVYHENVYSLNTIKSTFVLCVSLPLLQLVVQENLWLLVARCKMGKLSCVLNENC